MPASSSLPTPFTFSYDPATNSLRGHWAGPVNEAHLRTHYADLLAAASAHGNCCFWLLDMRVRNWHTPAFGHWYNTVFAEAAHAALHQPLFIAYVLNPEHRATADTPGVQATQRGCATYGVYPFFFDNELAAHAWLAHQQAHDRREEEI